MILRLTILLGFFGLGASSYPQTTGRSTTDLFDIRNGVQITRNSPTPFIAGMFGGGNDSNESGETIFSDGQPAGFTHFVEFQTPYPVTLQSIRVFSAGDGAIYLHEREFDRFVLRAKSSSASPTYDLLLHQFSPTHPYASLDSASHLMIDASIAQVTAQFFRAEFVQWNAGRAFDGPRVVELDAFGSADLPSSATLADWTFEQDLVSSNIQTVLDASGRAHSGTVFGQPKLVSSKSVAEGSRSLSLPGSASIAGGFEAQSQDFALGDVFTIETVIQPEILNTGTNRAIVACHDASSARLACSIDYRSETRFVSFSVFDSVGMSSSVLGRVPMDDSPHPIAAVYSNRVLRIYIDKALVESRASDLAPAFTEGGVGRIVVGTRDRGELPFHGTIDRVRFSNDSRASHEMIGVVPKPPAKPSLGTVPVSADLFDVSKGTVVTSHSPLLLDSEPEAAFGGTRPSVERYSTLFLDGGPGTTHYLEWKTPAPVELNRVLVFSVGDIPPWWPNQREFERFVLKTKSPGSEVFDKVLHTFQATHPYSVVETGSQIAVEANFAPIVAQSFRAEFVEWRAGGNFDGPRVLEIDAFGPASTNVPMADWTFEEGTPGSVAAKVLDQSGNRFDAMPIGAPRFVPSSTNALGKVSIRLSTISGAFGEALRGPDRIDFNFRDDFTLEASVTPDNSNTAFNRGIIVGQNAANGKIAYSLEYRSETQQTIFSVFDSSGNSASVTAALPSDGLSHHLGATFSNQVLRLYIDHRLDGFRATTLSLPFAPNDLGRLTVGANDVGAFAFQGIIDRVRISRRSLPPEEFFTENLRHPPVITSQPQSQDLIEGQPLVLALTATSTLPVTYEWYINGARALWLVGRRILASSASPSDSGTYTVLVRNADGATMSAPAIVNVSSSIPGGLVNFANFIPSVLDAPITNSLGDRASGTDYFAQLYAGSSSNALAPIGAAVPIQFENPGYIVGGTRLVPSVPVGATGFVQIRAWSATSGPSYEQAASKGGPIGSSAILAVRLGGGALPAADLRGLTGFALERLPEITLQPLSQSVLSGNRFTLNVSAGDSASLRYQWFKDGAPLSGETNASFTILSVAPVHAGSYTVEVRNSAGSIVSTPAILQVIVPDLQRPVVEFASPSSGLTIDESVTLRGTVKDNVDVVQVELQRNSLPPVPITLLSGGVFAVDIPVFVGVNRLTIRARDSAGNIGSAEIILERQMRRGAFIPVLGPAKEGALLSMPIFVRNFDDVSGITLDLSFPPEHLSPLEFIWPTAPAGALTQVLTNTPGHVKASYTLPGSVFPAGTNLFATLSFRVNGLPASTNASIGLQLIGAFAVDGRNLTNLGVYGQTITLLKREIVGDNNANDRIDIGDAARLAALLARSDSIPPWDIASNDLNENSLLDAGDLIRVLRSVVRLDEGASTNAATEGASLLSMTADKDRLVPGEKVTLRVSRTSMAAPVAGAAFTLRYPTNALRLDNAAGIGTAALLRENAITLWNLEPAQNDFGLQNGLFHFAACGDSPWQSGDGLLTLDFSVQTGATSQMRWPISIFDAELTDGWMVRGAQEAVLFLDGSEPAPVALSAIRLAGQSSLQLRIGGGSGANWRLESSSDLVSWSEVQTATNPAPFELLVEISGSHRFFRALNLP